MKTRAHQIGRRAKARGRKIAPIQPPAAPGDNISVCFGPTEYFTAGAGDEVIVMNARNLTGQCLIGKRLGGHLDAYFKLIPGDGSAELWAMDLTDIHDSGTSRPSGSYIYADGSFALVVVDGGKNPPYPVAGAAIALRLDMADGTQDWGSMPTATSGGQGTATGGVAGVDADETTDNVWWETNAGGDELKQFTASTGAEQAVSGNDSGLGSGLCALCATPNKDYVCGIGYGATPEIARWSVPMSGLANSYDSAPLNLAAVDTVNDFGYAERLEYCAAILPARQAGRNTAYFCMGYRSSNDNRYVGEFDPASGANGAVLNERDVISVCDFVAGTYNWAIDLTVDRWGYVYFLCINGVGVGDDTDIIRYDPDLSEASAFSFSRDGGITFPNRSTYGRPFRLTVDETDKVFLGLDGYVIGYEQAA